MPLSQAELAELYRTGKLVDPGFTPTKVVLKHEEEDENTGGPIGPLFYEGKDMNETAPVVLDQTQPRPGSKYGFFPRWYGYQGAKSVAQALNLPLEVF